MQKKLLRERSQRVEAISKAGGLESALDTGTLEKITDISLSEAIILGLIRQNVRNFISITGYGSTEIIEILRVYEAAGLLKIVPLRNEVEATHAAAALRRVANEKSTVITSIGPGALQAMAGSLAPLSDGLGVWFLIGDKTTKSEGSDMQQIPEQDQFLKLFSTMGPTYKLHAPGAISTALGRGLVATEHPYRQSPFFLLMPMNNQPEIISGFNLESLPADKPPKPGAATDHGCYDKAAKALLKAERVLVKVGGGAVPAAPEIAEFMELVDGMAVTSPMVPGLVPYSSPRNMVTGGQMETICGNYAMESADLLVTLGTRFVSQSLCSRMGYPEVRQVININGNVNTAIHSPKTIAMAGDIQATLKQLNRCLKEKTAGSIQQPSLWFQQCTEKRQEWEAFKLERYANPYLYDEFWKKEVLTRPAAIKTALDWASDNDVISFFDAGDIQDDGFQVVENERYGQTFIETSTSYMGFASSALLATVLAQRPFYGLAFTDDSSFVMNSQILIDAVVHGATGCILLMDNHRIAAISGRQKDQYQVDIATNDSVEVDYVAWGNAVKGVNAMDGGDSVDSLYSALTKAGNHKGLSLVYLRIYSGSDPLGAMGVLNQRNLATRPKKHRH